MKQNPPSGFRAAYDKPPHRALPSLAIVKPRLIGGLVTSVRVARKDLESEYTNPLAESALTRMNGLRYGEFARLNRLERSSRIDAWPQKIRATTSWSPVVLLDAV